MLDVTEAKVVSLLGLLFGTIFFGVFPIKVEQVLLSWHSVEDRESAVRRSRWGDTLLSWLLCFGGGVLFATCFIHMIPEVREGFEAAQV
jgi:zinc transporter 1/2/3